MLEKIDNFLLSVAKKMIEIAGFFGISRRRLIHLQIYTATIIMFVHVDQESLVTTRVFLIIIGWLLARFILIRHAMILYRDDDLLINSPTLTDRKERLAMLLAMYIVSFQFFMPTSLLSLIFWLFIKLSLPAYFWPWLILNQNSGRKDTAKDWLKAKGDKLKQSLKNLSPKPQPLPQPTSCFLK